MIWLSNIVYLKQCMRKKGSYYIGHQQRLRRACALQLTRQSLCCSQTCSRDLEEASDEKRISVAQIGDCACSFEEPQTGHTVHACSFVLGYVGFRPRGYKSFSMVNSAKHEIISANKYENANNSWHYYCWHFHIYQQRNFHAQLCLARKNLQLLVI